MLIATFQLLFLSFFSNLLLTEIYHYLWEITEAEQSVFELNCFIQLHRPYPDSPLRIVTMVILIIMAVLSQVDACLSDTLFQERLRYWELLRRRCVDSSFNDGLLYAVSGPEGGNQELLRDSNNNSGPQEGPSPGGGDKKHLASQPGALRDEISRRAEPRGRKDSSQEEGASPAESPSQANVENNGGVRPLSSYLIESPGRDADRRRRDSEEEVIEVRPLIRVPAMDHLELIGLGDDVILRPAPNLHLQVNSSRSFDSAIGASAASTAPNSRGVSE